MAQDGLFGPSPEILRQAIAAQQQQSEAENFSRQATALSQLGGAGFAGLMAGNIFGRAINRATGNSVEDPRVAKAKRLQAIKQEIIISGLEPGTDEHAQLVTRRLLEAGEFDLAMKAQQRAQQMKLQRAQIGLAEAQTEKALRPPAPKVPVSLLEFTAAQGDSAYRAFLKERNKSKGTSITNVLPGEGRLGRLLTPEEKAQAGLPPQTVAQVKKDGSIQIVDEVPGEQRSRLAALEQASADLAAAKGMVKKEDGSVDRRLLLEAKANAPRSRGRQFRQRMISAVEAQIRAESGAAIPPEEVARSAERFIADFFDSEGSIDDKFSRLENLITGTRRNLGQAVDRPSGKEWQQAAPGIRIRALD
jgi:hypothetical protein